MTRGRDIGVDVEHTPRRTEALEIADRFFSPREVRDLRALPAGEQRSRFFDYWTLKESYIKARGLGLAIPLHRFSFVLPPAAEPRLLLDPSLGDDAARWRFWLRSPTAEHRLALCLQVGPREEVGVQVAWSGPLP